MTQWELTSPQKAGGAANASVDLKVTAMAKVAFKVDHCVFVIQGTPSDRNHLARTPEHCDEAAGADERLRGDASGPIVRSSQSIISAAAWRTLSRAQ